MKKISLVLLVGLIFAASSTPVSAKTSQQLFDESFVKLQTLKTGSFTGSVESQIKYLPAKTTKTTKKTTTDLYLSKMLDQGPTTIKASFFGSFDDSDKAHPKTQMNFQMDPGTGIGSIKNFNLDLIKDNLTYYIFWNVPQLPQTTSTLFDISVFTNKWIKFDLSSLVADLQKAGFSKTNSTKLDEKKMKAGMLKSFKANKVFTATKLADVKNFNGVPAYHLKLTLNRTGYKNFMMDYSKLAGKPMTAAEKKDLATSMAQVQFPTNDIYLEKSTGFPLAMNINSINKTPTSVGTTKIKVTFSDFNKPVQISPPAQSSTVEEIWNTFMAQLKLK